MKVRGFGWVILAYLAAALVGALVVTIGFAIVATYSTIANEQGWDEVWRGLWILPAVTIYAFGVFIGGLLILGTPVWLLLVRLDKSSRRDAVIAGAVLSTLPVLAFLLAAGEPVQAWQPWVFALSITIPGAAAGWTLHRVAYGKARA